MRIVVRRNDGPYTPSTPGVIHWSPSTDGPFLAGQVAVVGLLDGLGLAGLVRADGTLGPTVVFPATAQPSLADVDFASAAIAAATAAAGTLEVEPTDIPILAGAQAHLAALAGLANLSGTQAGAFGVDQVPIAAAATPAGNLQPTFGQVSAGSQAANLGLGFNAAPFGAAAAIGLTQWSCVDRLAGKDTFVRTDRTLGDCNDDNTHNNENIHTNRSGVPQTTRDAYIAWDLSSFPAAGSVASATLKLNVLLAPAANANVDIFKIADSGEGWAEGTLKCSNAPGPDGAALQTLVFPPSTGQKSFSLNAGVVARLQARMGVGYCTLLLRMQSTDAVAAHDREDGAADGPRLAMTFTT